MIACAPTLEIGPWPKCAGTWCCSSANAIGNIGGFVGPFAIGWIRDATGSFTWGLIVVAAGILLTGVIALIVGHDARAEYGDDALRQPAPGLDGA
jgi:nitrate/nitrite transporter NarK